VAAFGACFYVAWNIVWIAGGHLPPSILQAFTGWPVATTGMTRSVKAALRGDVATSLSWNAFTVPVCVLLCATAVALIRRRSAGRSLVIPASLARIWMLVLAAAWVLKLAQGPQWW
jgi:hypothetical protein